MVLLQQATAYIFRKKTRNFILFLILFLILSCLYFCFSLMQVGGGMEAQIRKSGGASFSLVSKERGSAFSWKEGEKISHLPDVMSTIPQYVSPVRLIDKKVVTGKQTVERDDLDNKDNQALGATFTKETAQSVDFRSGAFQLLKGKYISAKGQIMIHESLARKNKLSVGDKLTLSNFQVTENGAKKMTFDIVGIFSGKKEETFTGMSSDLSENQIFLHYDDASQLLDLTDKLVTKLSFGIKNPDRINQVIKQVEHLDIDWNRLRLDEDRKAFDSLKESSKALQGIVRTMMISLIVTGAGILSFLMALWTRERNHEIGILLAIGKSKGRIFCSISYGDIVGVPYVFATCPCYWTATKSTVFTRIYRTARTAAGSSVIRSNSSGTTFRPILSKSSSLGNIIARCDNRSHLAQNSKRNLI